MGKHTKEYARAYYLAHKERIHEKSCERGKKNRDKVNAYRRKWLKSPLGKAWLEKNREKHIQHQRAWRLANPERYAATNARQQAKRRLLNPSQRSLLFWKRKLNLQWPRPIAEAMRRLGWSVKRLADQLQLHPAHVSGCLNRNTIHKASNFRHFNSEQMEQLQRVFAEAGEFVDILECWPEQSELIYLPPTDPPKHPSEESVGRLFSLVCDLKPLWRDAIVDRFYRGLTLEQSGQLMGVTREMIRLREARALEKLRHPSRLQKILPIAEELGIV